MNDTNVVLPTRASTTATIALAAVPLQHDESGQRRARTIHRRLGAGLISELTISQVADNFGSAYSQGPCPAEPRTEM